MNANLPISVAMCTYNGSRFLPEQLASIAAQTRLPDELVICDDGSTDATPEIIEAFARTAPFAVRFIRNPQNLGSTKNFEKAISLCTGDLIALSDQDDIWLPHKLTRQAEIMEADPELGGIFTDAELINDKSQQIGKRLWENIFFFPEDRKRFHNGHAADELLKRMVVTGATVMVRANLRSIFMPIPAIWVHDCWIAWMLIIYSKLESMEEPLIQYRLHAAQQIGVESLAPARNLPLRQRLEIGKREEPGKSLLAAQWLELLEQHLHSVPGPNNQAVLGPLRQRIAFYELRGEPYTSKVRHVARILKNAENYRMYEHGWKGMARDIVLMFV